MIKPLKEPHNFFLSERSYVTHRDFPGLVSDTWKTFRPESAINGFRKAGIVPLCHRVIGVESLAPSNPLIINSSVVNDSTSDDGDGNTDLDGQSMTNLLRENVEDITESNISIIQPIPINQDTTPSISLQFSPDIPSIKLPFINPLSPTTTPPSNYYTIPQSDNISPFIDPSTDIPTATPTTVSISPIVTPTTVSTSPMPTPTVSISTVSTSLTATPTAVSTDSSGLRDFFLSFFESKTPKRVQIGRSRRLASFGESLTAEEALDKQKKNEDEKKRKLIEKEERKRVRLEKKCEKQKQEEKKKRQEDRRKRKNMYSNDLRKSSRNKR